jgi:serine/threonine protein phosphatase 1
MGADALLRSYGLDVDQLPLIFPPLDKLDAFIRQSLPKPHIEFMRSLPILVDTPDVLFVHAGIDPLRSDRGPERRRSGLHPPPLLRKPVPLPKLIVHGHTPVDAA